MKVYTCSCGRRTTEPFIIRGQELCTICAEQEAPDVVNRREQRAFQTYYRSTRNFERLHGSRYNRD